MTGGVLTALKRISDNVKLIRIISIKSIIKDKMHNWFIEVDMKTEVTKKGIEQLTNRITDLLTGIPPEKFHCIYHVIYDALEKKGFIKDPGAEEIKNSLYYAQVFVKQEQYKKLNEPEIVKNWDSKGTNAS